MKVIPSLELFNKISNHIRNEGGVNHGLFLLSWKSGLRVSEAVSFDFHQKHPGHKDLYLVRGKGNKNRYVYISPAVISELKK